MEEEEESSRCLGDEDFGLDVVDFKGVTEDNCDEEDEEVEEVEEEEEVAEEEEATNFFLKALLPKPH